MSDHWGPGRHWTQRALLHHRPGASQGSSPGWQCPLFPPCVYLEKVITPIKKFIEMINQSISVVSVSVGEQPLQSSCRARPWWARSGVNLGALRRAAGAAKGLACCALGELGLATTALLWIS